MVLWLVSVAALVVAAVAWRQARRTAARLDILSQLYWDLRYQQLSASQTAPGGSPAAGAAADAPAASAGAGTAARPEGSTRAASPVQGFIPLISLKR